MYGYSDPGFQIRVDGRQTLNSTGMPAVNQLNLYVRIHNSVQKVKCLGNYCSYIAGSCVFLIFWWLTCFLDIRYVLCSFTCGKLD